MRALPTITAANMRAINRSAVLEVIRRSGPVSRSAIAAQLKLSLPTVMRIVEDLLQEGLASASGQSEWSGGRRRPLIVLNTSGRVVIGVDLGGTDLYGAITDLSGAVVWEKTRPFDGAQGEAGYALLEQTLADLLDHSAAGGAHVLGMGIGVPGVTDPDTGQVAWAPALDWHDFPLRSRLEQRFPGGVVEVENDVNLAALGELWFGASHDVENLVLIGLGSGIGAGVVIGGALYTGRHCSAGEIGYLLPDRQCLGKAYPDFGALETRASGRAILLRARAALAGTASAAELAALTPAGVFDAAQAGQPWAVEITADTVDYLAQAVAALQVVFDPDVILLGGGAGALAHSLIGPVLGRLQGSIPVLPNLRASSLGHRAAVLGAIVRLMRVADRYYSLQTSG